MMVILEEKVYSKLHKKQQNGIREIQKTEHLNKILIKCEESQFKTDEGLGYFTQK